MSEPTATTDSPPPITTLRPSDYESWRALFKSYITFYNTTIPESQYPKTFARLLDPVNKGELYGLVMRSPDDETKIIGLAHFFPKQTPWSEQRVMHFNDLFIDPEIRSRGYGRMMIEAVAVKARELGCTRLQWVTRHDNVVARGLYDKLAKCDFVEYRMALE